MGGTTGRFRLVLKCFESPIPIAHRSFGKRNPLLTVLPRYFYRNSMEVPMFYDVLCIPLATRGARGALPFASVLLCACFSVIKQTILAYFSLIDCRVSGRLAP